MRIANRLFAPDVGSHRPAKYRKQDFVAAIEASGGLVSLAAKNLGCTRETVYQAAKRYPEVREAIEASREIVLDETEDQLFKAAKGGVAWAVCFLLKCRGKSRGYVERQEISSPPDDPLRVDHAVRVYYLPDNGREKLALPSTGDVEAEAETVEPEKITPVVMLPDNGRHE